MATLTLTALWINLVATGAAVSAQSAPDRNEAYVSPVNVLTYAGGRRRAITGPGEAGSYAFTLRMASRTSVETLRLWVGQTVQVRDNFGRRFFGVYGTLGIKEWRDGTFWDVDIVLTVVTFTEGA
jgi:hypothetical protein